VTLYDPELIVLGGGLAEARGALLTPLTAALRGRLTFQTMPALARAELGDAAGCLGAALLAQARLAEDSSDQALANDPATVPR
jgi:glucokinase